MPLSHEQNLIEWRRYGHWDSSAAKAHFAAFALWQMRKSGQHEALAVESGHNSTEASLGLIEAFHRESAVALELVVKAVIAKQMRERSDDPAVEVVPATHDVPKLWQQAGLPPQIGDDLFRLHLVKSTLMWSGRYSTPKSAKAWQEENKAFDVLENPTGKKRDFTPRTPIGFDWDDFDRLYQIAYGAL